MAALGERGWIGSAAALLLLVQSIARPADDPSATAAAQLERRGLVKVTGRVWGLPLEQQLRQRLRRLPELRERIVAAQKELDEHVARNDLAWKAAAAAIAAINQQLAQLPSDDLQRVALLQQRAKLNAGAVPPAELAGRDAVRTALARLSQDQCSLTLDLLWIRNAAARLVDRYRELAGDEELSRLIAASGEKSRLGPARNYHTELRKLAEYDKLALADHVPIYLQSGRVRVTAAVNDALCVTFSWNEASDAATYLPASAAHAAGIEVPADAREETLRISGRRITAREVFLPSLRLGKVHTKSVAALILPPEAEDLGAQLTPLALSPYRVKVERERLRLVVE